MISDIFPLPAISIPRYVNPNGEDQYFKRLFLSINRINFETFKNVSRVGCIGFCVNCELNLTRI